MKQMKLTDHVTVGAAMDVSDFAEAKAQGFASIINNRTINDKNLNITPDEEAAEAAKQGLDYRHIPMNSGTISIAAAHEMANAFRELPKPILAHCAGATRSAVLWSVAEAANGRPCEEIIAITGAAGFDLMHLVPLLRGLNDDVTRDS